MLHSKLVFSLLIMCCSFIFSSEWIQLGENYISSKKLVIKFKDYDEFNSSKPVDLQNKQILNQIASSFGSAVLTPTFSNYNKFTSKHRKHQLHLYYNLKFNKSINIFDIKALLTQNKP